MMLSLRLGLQQLLVLLKGDGDFGLRLYCTHTKWNLEADFDSCQEGCLARKNGYFY